MAASDVRAGRAFVEIFVKDRSVSASLDKIGVIFKAWGAKMEAIGQKIFNIGAIGSTALASTTIAFATMGSNLKLMSERTGIAVESLSTLKFAADQVGVSSESLENAIKRMQRTIFSAVTTTGEARQAFTDLKIPIQSLAGLSPDQQFAKITSALGAFADPTIKAGLALKIFGRAGTDILPVVGQMGQLVTQAKTLGIVMSDQDATAALQFQQNLKKLWDVLEMVTFQVGAALAPALEKTITLSLRYSKLVIDFVKTHRQLVVAVSAATLGVAGLGLAIKVAGITFGGFGTVLGFAASTMSTFAAVTAGTIGLIFSATGGIVALSAVMIGFSGYMIYASKVGQSVWGYLKNVWKGLADDAIAAFDGIRDALKAGDFSLAAQILWTSLKIEWIKGTESLKEVWTEFQNWFNDKLYGGLELFHTITAKLKSIWINLVADLKSNWSQLTTFLGNELLKLAGFVTNGPLAKMFALIAKLNGVGDQFKQLQTLANPANIGAATANNNTADAATQKAIADERIAKQAALQADLNSTLSALATANQKANSDNRDTTAGQVAELEKKKNDLQHQLAKLKTKAHIESKEPKLGELPALPNPPGFDADAAERAFHALQRQSTMGTFNVTRQFQISAGGGQDQNKKMLAGIENIVKNTAGLRGARRLSFS